MNGLVSFAAMPVKCGAGPAATKEGALQAASKTPAFTTE
jgi:hypothetical protein